MSNHLLQKIFDKPYNVTSRTEMEKGASSRRYFRITLEGEQVPSSIVEMMLPEDAMKSDEVAEDLHFDELPFVNVANCMGQQGLPVPAILLDATKEGFVFIEDLGTITLNKRIQNKDSEYIENWYFTAVELLVQMHDSMWPVPKECYASNRFFDYSLLRWELDHYKEWGLETRLNLSFTKDDETTLNQLFDDFAKQIDALPKGFVHRDYQSRNLMTLGDTPTKDNLSIIDFQDALIGPRVYDLVALLNDSYVDLSDDLQTRLIKHYATLRHIHFEDVRNEFDLITVQRKLKDGGRFIFIDRVKNDSSFLPFVEKSFSRVKKALSRLNGHVELKQLLAKLDPACFQSII